jgi:hypothetical protein
MVRRTFLLGTALLLMLLAVPACNSDSKPKNKGPAIPDPEGNAKPNAPKPG